MGGAADLAIRLSLTDADLVLQTLRNVGVQGQNAMAVVEAASDKATVSGQKFERQVASLKNTLDPTTKAMADQARSQDVLNAALSRGSLTTADHTKFTELLAARYKEVVPVLGASASAHDAHGKSSYQSTLRTMEFFHAGRSVTEMLIAGQSPLKAFTMEGVRLAGVMGASGVSLGAIAGSIGAIAAPILGTAGVMAIGAARAAEMAKEVRTLGVALEATGRAGELGAANLQSLAHDAARTGPFNRSDTLTAVKELGASPRIPSDLMPEMVKVSKDFAAATGEDLPKAAKKLAEAMDGGYKSIHKLNDEYNFLTPSQLTTIRQMYEQGDVMEATKLSADAMRDHFADLAEKGMGPLDKAGRSLRVVWDDLADSMAKRWQTPGIDDKLEELKGLAHPQGILTRFVLGDDTTNALEAEQKAKIAELERAKVAMSTPDPRKKTQDLSIYQQHSMETYDYSLELANEKRKTEQMAPALRAEATARYKALHDNTLSGGYAERNQDLAAREARDTRETGANDAAKQAEIQTEAQNRLTDAAGKGSVAQMEAARANAVAAFAFHHTGDEANRTSDAVVRYSDALKGTDAAKLVAERAEWIKTLEREGTASAALTAAYRAGDPAAIRRAEATKQAVEANRKFGISVDEATKALVEQHQELDAATISRQTADLNRHATAEERLAAVAGQGAVAQRTVARANALVEFSFQHAGAGVEAYKAALERTDAAKLLAERTDWLKTIDREVAANTNLAAAYRSGDRDFIHSAEVRAKAEDANRKFGISVADATVALERERAALSSVAITKRIDDMKALSAVQDKIFRAQRAYDPAAARQAAVDEEVAKFGRAHPRRLQGTGPDTTDTDLAEVRRQYLAESTLAMGKKALAAEEGANAQARHRAAQGDLDDLARIVDADGKGILSKESVAAIQRKIDEDYRRGQIENLMATRTFTGGAQAAFAEYAHNATNAALQMQGVIDHGMKSLEDGIVGVLDGTKSWKLAFNDLSKSVADDLLRMSVRQNLTGPFAERLGIGAGKYGGMGGGLFGSLFGSVGSNTASSGDPMMTGIGYGSSSLFSGLGSWLSNMFHDGGIVGSGGTPRMADPGWWAGAARYHTGGIVGLRPDELPIIARRGERVQTAEQQASGNAAVRPVSVVMHITTPDASSFRASQGQIAAQMAQAVSRGQRNL